MKYRFISDHRERANVGLMCKVLNISRSGYYAWLKRPRSRRSKENRKLADHIRIIHAKSRKIYGAPRIYRKLRENGISCSQNRVARIMKQEGIRSVAPENLRRLQTQSTISLLPPICSIVILMSKNLTGFGWLISPIFLLAKDGFIFLPLWILAHAVS